MIAFMAVQIRAGGILILTYFSFDYLFACFIITIIIAFYIWLGGAKADAYTDALQVSLIMLFFIGGITFLL
ncbi:unnamed protein product, partial [marine sediment metagenome]